MEDSDHLKKFTLDPHPEFEVVMSLYSGVTNAKELRNMLLNGEISAALLKAKLVSDTLPVLVAACKAVDLFKKGALKTKNVHTELLYNLSPTNSINDSLSKFGIGDIDTDILVVVICEKIKDCNLSALDVNACVQGNREPICNLSISSSPQALLKMYKIGPEELSVGSITDAIICRIASKEVI